MTKDEIIALIDAKIAGQGTNIDAGSALPEILNGILDLASGDVVRITGTLPVTAIGVEAAANALGITAAEFQRILAGEVPTIIYNDVLMKLSWVYAYDTEFPTVGYGGSVDTGYEVVFGNDGDVPVPQFEIVFHEK